MLEIPVYNKLLLLSPHISCVCSNLSKAALGFCVCVCARTHARIYRAIAQEEGGQRAVQLPLAV
jgi:hypothetical protein